MPDHFPDGLEIFTDDVVPLLRLRNLFRHEYEASTLRERLCIRSTPWLRSHDLPSDPLTGMITLNTLG